MGQMVARLRGQRLLVRAAGDGMPSVSALLPHRPPFLFLDRIVDVDPAARCLRAAYDVRQNDAIFAGHFPGDPVYPAVLQLEAMGQAATCLLSIEQFGLTSIRLSHIRHASFFLPIPPGALLDIHCCILDDDPLIATFGAQVWLDIGLASIAIGDLHAR